MKTNYIKPKAKIIEIECENMIADSPNTTSVPINNSVTVSDQSGVYSKGGIFDYEDWEYWDEL